MAFFRLVLKARKLEKLRLTYEEEKLKSFHVSEGVDIKYTLAQRIRHKKIRLKYKLKNGWNKITSCPKNSWCHKKGVLLRTNGTFENYVLKSIFGFIGGIFLTYLFFMFFVIQLHFSLASATALCSFIGIILTLGLAFSYRVRCVVFLLLPQFFSKRGRQALMAYAFILTLTGPTKNTLQNLSVLTDSLSCGQEQLKTTFRAIVDIIKRPFHAAKNAIAKVVREIKTVVSKIRKALLAIKRTVLDILKAIKGAFEWLGSVVNMCNKKLGTPFERCQKVFESAKADCKASLGDWISGICDVTDAIATVCYVTKPLDLICQLVDFISDSIIGVVKRKIRAFVTHMRAMFYVKVKFSHSFHFETNQSRTFVEVSNDIVTEIKRKTDKVLSVFDWMSLLTSLLFLFMLLRVIRYRYKWMTSERFDNHYLTNDLREIDLRRAKLDKETVLPLNRRERRRYIRLTSMSLVRSEKISLAKAVIFLSLATFKLGIHMMVDYCLYWTLSIIRYHGRSESEVEAPNSVGVLVSGSGFLADLYRSIVRAFSPFGTKMDLDTIHCLPDPIPPDLDRYTQITWLIALCWIMAIFQPYGLRLRQLVMIRYNPDRAKQRAVWLYNHIIRSRGNFLKFARRQLRRKFSIGDNSDAIEKVTCGERILAVFPILQRCFGNNRRMCVLCGAVERDDDTPFVKCAKPGCVGLYCAQCFADMRNLCTICLEPIEYGDLSDISEEKDSSDDDLSRRGKQVRFKSLEKNNWNDKSGGEKEALLRNTPRGDNESDGESEDAEGEDEEGSGRRNKKYEKKDGDGDDTDKGGRDSFEAPSHNDTGSSDASDLHSSSSTVYSYSYQNESPGKMEPTRRSNPYKDVEAQTIGDEVTLQLFHEESTDDDGPSDREASFYRQKRRSEYTDRLTRTDWEDPTSSSMAASTAVSELFSSDDDEKDFDDCFGAGISPHDTRDDEKLSIVDKIGNMMRIRPKIHSAFPRVFYKPLENSETTRATRLEKIASPRVMIDFLSPRDVMSTNNDSSTSLSEDLEGTIAHKNTNDENYELDDLQLSRRNDPESWSQNMERVKVKQPHQEGFGPTQSLRYVKSAIENVKYVEINEKMISKNQHSEVIAKETTSQLPGSGEATDFAEHGSMKSGESQKSMMDETSTDSQLSLFDSDELDDEIRKSEVSSSIDVAKIQMDHEDDEYRILETDEKTVDAHHTTRKPKLKAETISAIVMIKRNNCEKMNGDGMTRARNHGQYHEALPRIFEENKEWVGPQFWDRCPSLSRPNLKRRSKITGNQKRSDVFSDSYFTEPEDGPRNHVVELSGSTFRDDGIIPRRKSASRHEKCTGKEEK